MGNVHEINLNNCQQQSIHTFMSYVCASIDVDVDPIYILTSISKPQNYTSVKSYQFRLKMIQ